MNLIACGYCMGCTDIADQKLRAERAEAECARLREAIHETLALVTSRDPVAVSPFDAIGVYKLALEHLRAALTPPKETER